MNFAKCHSGSCVAVNGGTEISQISFKRSSKDERKSYRFGTRWEWV